MKPRHHLKIAIIGAGLAGLACARMLADAGMTTRVFEKSRGFGGRLATRRLSDLAFDHGAQFVTARSDGFRELIDVSTRAGAVAPWRPLGAGGGETWYVGVPGMSALVRPLSAGLDIRLGRRVIKIERRGGRWFLHFDGYDLGEDFDALVLAIPAPQAIELLGVHADPLTNLKQVSIAPCWAAIAAFDDPIGIETDILEPTRSAIAWAARNNSKPARSRALDQWVIHATPEWSRVHLEDDPRDIVQGLMEEMRALIGQGLHMAQFLAAHRWRYARVERPLGQDFLWDNATSLGLAGDWCVGARAEAAFRSGTALAEAMLSTLHPGLAGE